MDYDDFFSLYDSVKDSVHDSFIEENNIVNDDEKIDVKKIMNHIKNQEENELLNEDDCANCNSKYNIALTMFLVYSHTCDK